MHVDDLLRIAVERGASDLHLKVGNYPMCRIHGQLGVLNADVRLGHEAMVEMGASIMSSPQRQKFKDTQEVDLAYSVSGVGRFRCNVFQQRGSIGIVARVIPSSVKSLEALGLPEVLKAVAMEERGLVVVTGTTGSGKSTTLAGMVDYINRNRAAHIITIEDPIEYLHHDEKSVLNQREIGSDTRSFAAALRSALRQDPDVVLVSCLSGS